MKTEFISKFSWRFLVTWENRKIQKKVVKHALKQLKLVVFNFFAYFTHFFNKFSKVFTNSKLIFSCAIKLNREFITSVACGSNFFIASREEDKKVFLSGHEDDKKMLYHDNCKSEAIEGLLLIFIFDKSTKINFNIKYIKTAIICPSK